MRGDAVRSRVPAQAAGLSRVWPAARTAGGATGKAPEKKEMLTMTPRSGNRGNGSFPAVRGGTWTAVLALCLISPVPCAFAQAPAGSPGGAVAPAGARPDQVPAYESAGLPAEPPAPAPEAEPRGSEPPAETDGPTPAGAEHPAPEPQGEPPATPPEGRPPAALPAGGTAAPGEAEGKASGVSSVPAPVVPGRSPPKVLAAPGSADPHAAVAPVEAPVAPGTAPPIPEATAPEAAPDGTPRIPGMQVAPGGAVPPAADGLPAATAPARPAQGGLFSRMARSLFGKKAEDPNQAGGAGGPSSAEEDSTEPENQENQRKAKELVRLALQNIEKKRISEAKKNINDLITLKPYEADYHLALGLCFRQEKRYRDALKKYQDVLDLGGPKALVNLLRAEVAAAEGEKLKVYEYLKEAAMGGRNIVHDVQNLPLLEKYKSDTEFIKLALYLEKFEVSSKRNQDPFTNPFPASAAPGAPKGPQAAPNGPVTLPPQDQQNLLNEARRLYEKVQWYIKLEDEDKAMENYIKLRDIIDKKELITLPKLANDFRILMGRMETLETQIEGIRLKYYWNQAQTRLKEMKEAFLATEYAKVDATYTDVEKLTKEMERSNPRFKPVAERILAAAKVWQSRTNVRREFQASKPEIQGVVISDDAKMAIVDNRIVKQGERFGEFYLQKVENNRLTFRYKGEEIPLIFRRY